MKAIVYGTSKCSWCDRVANMLNNSEIEVEKIDVSESKENLKSSEIFSASLIVGILVMNCFRY